MAKTCGPSARKKEYQAIIPLSSIELLKRETKVTDNHLDTRVEEADLPEVASCFDNTVTYVEKLQLSPGQQTDVKTQAFVNGTQAGMMVALKHWRNRNPVQATFRALLLILLSLLRGDVAVQVCKYLSLKHFSGLQSHKLFLYKDYLQTYYRGQTFSTSTQWPPLPTAKVFKLAMIQREKIQRGIIDTDFVRLSITGKVDDILQCKTPIELEDICSKVGTKPMFVLIEGAPGSGKSTLALHICQQWAENKLFQEYDVVVLVRLRDPLIRNAKSVADILPCTDRAMANKTENELISMYGQSVLWVLDGWDELPSDLPPDSIINKLVCTGVSRENLLPKSAMIVTSRSCKSGDLHPFVSLRVEVLGFTPNELKKYFSECLNGNSVSVMALMRRIQENPVVESSCYLPLNASIVAHVFLSCDHSLPTSNHKIFTSVVRFSLSRYMQDRLHIPPERALIPSLDVLPRGLQCLFVQLCKLAYFGVVEGKITFTSNDFLSAGVTLRVCDIGLLQTVPSILVDSREFYYNFLHLSVQELLAAIHISHMAAHNQLSVFYELFDNPRFTAVFQFYAGITKLKIHRPFLSLLPKILFPNTPREMLDILSIIVKNGEKSQIVSLLQCLFETEDPSLCVFVAKLLNCKLNFSYITLSPLDCLSIGYFLSVASTTISGEFKVDLYNCSISDLGCKFLVQGLCKCLHSDSKVTACFDLYLVNNDIGEEGTNYLSELLKNDCTIWKLVLSNNPIRQTGLKSLCEALSTNTTLKELYLSHCSIVISEYNGPSLCQLLKVNCALRSLDLSFSKCADCRYLGDGLSSNKTLRVLKLYSSHLTDKSMEYLANGLNNYIEELDINDNYAMTTNGLKILARELATLCGLKRIRVSIHLRQSIKTIFSEVNEERRRNRLTAIEVIAPRSLLD